MTAATVGGARVAASEPDDPDERHVEKRKLTKNCAGCKGHKPNALVIVPKMNTRAASGDDIKG